MPIVEVPRPKLVKEVVNSERISKFGSYPYAFKDFLRIKVEEHGAQFLGMGSDRFVFATNEDPERAVAIEYRSLPEEIRDAKMAFYLQRIYSTLWPHNFPQVYASLGATDALPAATFRQRIHSGGPMRNTVGILQFTDLPVEANHAKSFSHVVNDCVRSLSVSSACFLPLEQKHIR